MRAGNPLLSLHSALAAAIYRDLPDVQYENRDFDAELRLRAEVGRDEVERRRAAGELPMKKCIRRPTEDEVEVIMFEQMWGSTALGYGGIGGQAGTAAYTVIVQLGYTACVYFGGRALAYTVPIDKITDRQVQAWKQALADRYVVGRREALGAYGALLPGAGGDE